jgi:hypothetical protein
MSGNPVFADHPNLLRTVGISETKASVAEHFHRLLLHHGEVGAHVGAVEEGSEGSHRVRHAAVLLDDFFVAVPLPGVLEGGDLGGGAGAVFFGEEDVVVPAGVEGWVEVDEVGGLVGDVFAENLEIIAVVELVFLCGHSG